MDERLTVVEGKVEVLREGLEGIDRSLAGIRAARAGALECGRRETARGSPEEPAASRPRVVPTPMTGATPEPIDAAIVGGGVVGLAAACAVAARGHATCVVERLPRPGLEASTHNSGVVHAGIYYPPDSLKAVLCVEGRERLYAFCHEHGVPCERCGKLVVAVRADEIGALEALAGRGHANG